MATYVSLLRAINLGSRNRIGMAALADMYRKLGLSDAQTFIQSGNVLFTSRKSPTALTAQIEAAIRGTFGLEIVVVLRTREQMAQVCARHPFAGHPDAKLLAVAFLQKAPTAAAKKALAGLDIGDDEAHILGKEVYMRFSGGYSRSKLAGPTLEKLLGVAATVRNWTTTQKLLALAREHE